MFWRRFSIFFHLFPIKVNMVWSCLIKNFEWVHEPTTVVWLDIDGFASKEAMLATALPPTNMSISKQNHMTLTFDIYDILWDMKNWIELDNLKILDVHEWSFLMFPWMSNPSNGFEEPATIMTTKIRFSPRTSLGCGRCANWYGQLNASAPRQGDGKARCDWIRHQ